MHRRKKLPRKGQLRSKSTIEGKSSINSGVIEHEDLSSSSEEDSASNPYANLLETLKFGTDARQQATDSEPSSSSEEEPEANNKRMKMAEKELEKIASSDEGEGDVESDIEEKEVLRDEEEPEPEMEELSPDDKLDLLIFGDSDEETEQDVKDGKKNRYIDYYKTHMEENIEDKINDMEHSKPREIKTLHWPTLSTLRCMYRTSAELNSEKPHSYIPDLPIMKHCDPISLEKIFHVRKNLVDNWFQMQQAKPINGDMKYKDDSTAFTPLQRELFTLFNSYSDVCYSGQVVEKNAEEIRNVYCLHAANHILRARSKVLQNTARLKQMTPVQCEQTDYRDQGLSRPKVLILLPFRETALRVVNILLQLLKRGTRFEVSYKRRFRDEFGKKKDDDDSDDDSSRMLKKTEDFRSLFAGNTDEHFRIGIALLRNSVRLYAPFYSSDIIIASPLGLRTVIGAEGESHHEHDFLSSIELLIMDHTDVFLMQNWDHILHIFQHLHRTPKESHGVDFSRVRNWSLDGQSKYYRQTITISSVSLPQISSLFTKFCWNYRGSVMTEVQQEKGSICSIAKQLPQVFHKLIPATLVDSAEVRFKFFVDRIYNQYKDPSMSHTLIYVPQYFDFVRLRNYMRKQRKDGSGPVFGQVNDYSTPTEVGKAKRRFFTGKCRLLLYTERFHFYNRTRFRGIRNLVFYELPTYPHFYSEMCNMVRDSAHGSSVPSSNSVLVTYSRYDARKVSAIVGQARCRELLTSSKSVHMFVTGSNEYA